MKIYVKIIFKHFSGFSQDYVVVNFQEMNQKKIVTVNSYLLRYTAYTRFLTLFNEYISY